MHNVHVFTVAFSFIWIKCKEIWQPWTFECVGRKNALRSFPSLIDIKDIINLQFRVIIKYHLKCTTQDNMNTSGINLLQHSLGESLPPQSNSSELRLTGDVTRSSLHWPLLLVPRKPHWALEPLLLKNKNST